MRPSARQFLDATTHAITLLGMSGVGKTTLANKLPKDHWFHYSGDYRIGTKYLEEPILDNIKRQAMRVPFLRDLLRSDSIYIRSNITVHNLEPVSSFLGKLGDPSKGGLALEEFRRRQALHREAEIGAMLDCTAFIEKAREIYDYRHFVNDAGGSVCELDHPRALESLAEHTVILYLKADPDLERELIKRQRRHPKPLYFHPEFLARELEDYVAERGLARHEQILPDDFVQWIFPRLVAHRRPRYEAIAQRFGYTVDAREAETVRDDTDFLALTAAAIERCAGKTRTGFEPETRRPCL